MNFKKGIHTLIAKHNQIWQSLENINFQGVIRCPRHGILFISSYQVSYYNRLSVKRKNLGFLLLRQAVDSKVGLKIQIKRA